MRLRGRNSTTSYEAQAHSYGVTVAVSTQTPLDSLSDEQIEALAKRCAKLVRAEVDKALVLDLQESLQS